MHIEIDLDNVYQTISGPVAKLADMEKYEKVVLNKAGAGNDILLTGGAPIWMYLKIAHALHGKALSLTYSAPGQGIQHFEIFNHNPHCL